MDRKIIVKVQPVLDESTRLKCLTPYGLNTNGCPNYGKKKGCPPGAPLFADFFDLSKPVYAVAIEFDFEVTGTKKAGKEDEQVRSSSHWRQELTRSFRMHIKNFLRTHRGYKVTDCPEAMGVDITKTLSNVGIHLEWPPRTKAYRVALAGVRKEGTH